MNDARRPRIGRLLVLLVLAGVLFAVFLKVQVIRDAIRLHGYEPSQLVRQLADSTTMTDEARKLFYVNHPVVASRSSFSEHCSSRGEQTIVLGCYHAVDRGIYLFDVNDVRLTGVEEVTAAHEMLHAAYDRLGRGERQRIDRLLQDFNNTRVTDQRLKQTIAAYQKSEPRDVVNEMHSIFATEVADLPPELESYYGRYFQNRQKIVDYAERYQQEFSARRARVATLDRELAAIRIRMDGNRAALDRQEAAIEDQRNRLDELRASGNLAAYNTAVPVFNLQVDRYNTLIATTRAQIDEYNRIVAERNTLALEVKELAQSINSQPAPLSR